MCSPVNLANCGLNSEQHIAHVADGLDHLGALSTKKQHERKWEEHKEFVKVAIKMRQSLWTAASIFCNAGHKGQRGHRGDRNKNDGQQEEAQNKKDEITDKTSMSKCVFEIEDCTKVMDHIKKNIEGVEPENWVARN